MKSQTHRIIPCFLTLTTLASCAFSQPATEARTVALDANAALLKTRLVGTPVSSARAWSTGIAPNSRGGWNFITQFYEVKSKAATEYVVVDMQTGKYTITEGKSGQYTNSNYQWFNQARAANGRIFFSELDNVVSYYDPKDEQVHTIGQLIDPKDKDKDKFIFRLDFGPDGKLYGSTQANGLPAVVQIDPETLEHRVLGHVGKNRKLFSYGYYIAADPTPSEGAPQGWVYVAVGQEPWELAALNIATGQEKILAERADAGFLSFDVRPEGLVVKLISGMGRPDAKNEPFWLVDGQLFPFDPNYDPAKLPFKPRDVKPKQGALDKTPDFDISQLNADADGKGRVSWRPNGSTSDADWKEVSFVVKNTSPIELESLLALPDGSIMGNAKQYHGFFRYYPDTGKTSFYGAHGPSGGPRTLANGLVYITGYPSSVLYAYDPTKPWTSNRRIEASPNYDALDAKTIAALNPRKIGTFHTHSETHYSYFLTPSKNGRLYFSGRVERTGTGGAVGWYDPATKTYGGHFENLSFLIPRGFAVLDGPQRVVYSGELQDDPAKPNQTPAEAQLVVYDMELKETERLTVKPGLLNTGQLFPAADPNQIIGVITTRPARKPAEGEAVSTKIGDVAIDPVIYRYDVANKKLLDWVRLPGVTHEAIRRESDGSLWLEVDGSLMRVDAKTLAITTEAKLPFDPQLMAWQGDSLYLTNGGELRVAMLKK